MKKLILLLMIVMMASCATTSAPVEVEDPYATLTIEKVSKFCRPVNVWNVGILQNPAIIVTYEDCLEIEELLIVMAPVMTGHEELGITIVKVVQLSYVQYLTESDKDNDLKVTLLKAALRDHSEKNEKENTQSHVYFYSLERTKKSN
jgi:hypothetical protein